VIEGEMVEMADPVKSGELPAFRLGPLRRFR
jgi:hypothetical protein